MPTFLPLPRRVRPALTLLGVVALLGALAVAVGAAPSPTAPLQLAASPDRRTVAAGETAQFTLAITRDKGVAPVRLTVDPSLPAGVRATVTPEQTTGTGAKLTLTTDDGLTPDGSTAVTVRATSGAATATTTVTLTVSTPAGRTFPVSGDVQGLAPGVTRPIDLVLTNPENWALDVTALQVALLGISGPNISATRPCTEADFLIGGYTGAVPLRLPPGTHTLSSLGVPAARRPQLTMLDRPRNQDGCKAAVERLAYTATARKAQP
jgi:hypothetical protein